MGMPITVEIIDQVDIKIFQEVFKYFKYIDQKFSTYKKTSEISLINEEKLDEKDYSSDMKKILRLSKQTKRLTSGYFNIYQNGLVDPSGLVKGWAIWMASKILKNKRVKNFYIEAGGDIEVLGKNTQGKKWKIGIKNPFNPSEIVKVVELDKGGIATSGTYERGNHIYNPKSGKEISEIVSLTLIGQNIYQADRFATAAFAMGEEGIKFIEGQKDLEGYMINSKGIATATSGFSKYVKLDG